MKFGDFPIETNPKMPLDTIVFVKDGKEVGRIEGINMDNHINKPFFELLEKSKAIHLKKSADYAKNTNLYSNFEFSGLLASKFTHPVDISMAALIGTKLERLANLLSSDKDPQNESIEDNFLDLFTYMGLWASYRDYREQNMQGPQPAPAYQETAKSIRPNKQEEFRTGQWNTTEPPRNIEYVGPNKPSELIIDPAFEHDLRKILNKYGIDNQMNIADTALTSLLITQLYKIKGQMY